MDKVDITLSVLIDVAAAEYHKTTDRIIKELGISADIAEIAMEKAISSEKARRISLYATAIYSAGKKEGAENGDPDD